MTSTGKIIIILELLVLTFLAVRTYGAKEASAKCQFIAARAQTLSMQYARKAEKNAENAAIAAANSIKAQSEYYLLNKELQKCQE